VFAQQSLHPKLSRRRYASVSYALQNNKSSDAHRTESVSVMDHEQTMGVNLKVRGEIIRTVLCYSFLDWVFVTLGPFHCAYIHLCLCVYLCFFVNCMCIIIITWYSEPDGIDA